MIPLQNLNPQEIQAKANAIRNSDQVYSQALHDRIKKAWRLNRPKMTSQLRDLKILDDLALVLQMAMWESEEAYSQSGMPLTDAREQAEREWLMLDPENEQE